MTEQELQAIKERADKPLISTIDKPMTYAAESRQDITKLLAEVKRLREALEDIQDVELNRLASYEEMEMKRIATQALEGDKQ